LTHGDQAAGGPHEHQAYYGDRTPEAIASFVDLQVQSLEKKVEVEKKVVQNLPGIHTMQNLNEYLRALQEHGVNQVTRDAGCHTFGVRRVMYNVHRLTPL
jgi:hypothetical protein